MTYHEAEKKVLIKKKAAGGKYQFGAANSATPPLLAPVLLGGDTEGNNKQMGLSALDVYFDNVMAEAKMNEKSVLKELVTKLTTLTNSNVDMAATIKKIPGENIQL